MSWLNKNLDLVKKFDSKLYERLQQLLVKDYKPQHFNIHQARNGELTLHYNDGIKCKYLLSSFNPSLECKKWAENQKKAEIFLVYGFGLGYHLSFLDNKNVEKIFLIEPSMEIFLLALDNIDLKWLLTSEKYILSIAEKDECLLQRLKHTINKSFGKKLELVGYPSYIEIYADQYYNLVKEIGEIIDSSIIKVNTLKKFAISWTFNFFHNLYFALKSNKILNLFNKFIDVPIIIISAGPSLTKNIHLLKKAKGKALLLCVGTAYKALKAHDIKPDFIVSFDGGIANYRHFENVEINVPLIFDPIIYHQILKEYKGDLVAANISNPFLSWVEEQLNYETGELLIGPSVANVTFDLARKFGGNPIIFVGQDLAYTDGKSHADGTVYKDIRYENTGSIYDVEVEDIFGNSVVTNRSWKSFLRWFEREIENTFHTIIIDATEGGAKINGCEIMSLSTVIDKYCITEYAIEETIENFLSSYVEPDKIFFQNAVNCIEKIYVEILEFKDKSSIGLEMLDELSDLFKASNPNNRKIKNILKKLENIDKTLLNFQDSKIFLGMIFQPLVATVVNCKESKAKSQETEEEMQVRIIKFSKKLYHLIKEISELVLKMIDNAKKDFIMQ